MPKMKTNRGAAKRFKLTSSGKIKRSKSGKRHILTKKDQTRKVRLRKTTTVDKSNEKQIKALLVV